MTYHSRKEETWSVTERSQVEVLSDFDGIGARPRQLPSLPRSRWRRATADRDPIARWSFERATSPADAAHPTLRSVAQGACMALEDAVTLVEARAADGDFVRAFAHCERWRVTPERFYDALEWLYGCKVQNRLAP